MQRCGADRHKLYLLYIMLLSCERIKAVIKVYITQSSFIHTASVTILTVTWRILFHFTVNSLLFFLYCSEDCFHDLFTQYNSNFRCIFIVWIDFSEHSDLKWIVVNMFIRYYYYYYYCSTCFWPCVIHLFPVAGWAVPRAEHTHGVCVCVSGGAAHVGAAWPQAAQPNGSNNQPCCSSPCTVWKTERVSFNPDLRPIFAPL